ncbi:MAG: hypothetical protein EBU90_02040 [Proteobacteria bacterium]|nr:hypothetical protein [Pseudomonadota bacterium]NBP13262.1 hypothetical protein [bacterium]
MNVFALKLFFQLINVSLILAIDLVPILFFCSEFKSIYKWYTNKYRDLQLRQRSYILSMYSSGIQTLFGIYFNWLFYMAGYDVLVYARNNSILQLAFAKLCVHIFTSYLITDIIIGTRDYHSTLKTMTGYFHHIVYIFINVISIYSGLYPLYSIFMIAELPTFILALGSVVPQYRKDLLFGVSFFTTRIAYFLYISVLMSDYILIRWFTAPILVMHSYWFYKWIKNYFTVYLRKSANQVD